MYVRVVRAQLRRDLRRCIEQRAAIYSLVEASVAANAFRIQRRGEKIARDAAIFGAVLKDVAIESVARNLALRRQRADAVDSRQRIAQKLCRSGAALAQFRQHFELS